MAVMRDLCCSVVVSLLLAVFGASVGKAQTLADYLPEGVSYDESVPTPASVLGWEVGTWHVRHDQLVRYFEVLAQNSERVTLERYGSTHEQRPLLLATISAPANLGQIDAIRSEHTQAAVEGRLSTGPVVSWLGYSVHGNESSGANASLLVAYHLAAAQDDATQALLADTIVLIDPTINPDGLARHAQWANAHKGQQLVADPAHREHHEVWPGGRTNHYWFDLNRDWLLLIHPESRARIERFHAWRPHVLADFHEMGTGSTYFFQPGVPSRTNPRTPAGNQELTARLAKYHARTLDAHGRLYYSEETFDDFYYGKGSTYPDVHGSVGILFEQAGSRGHLQQNAYGELPFSRTIHNQFLTSLSTLNGAHELGDELKQFQEQAARSAIEEATQDPVQAYLFGHSKDASRVAALLDILLRHQIKVFELNQGVRRDGQSFLLGRSYLVPTIQPQYRLVKSLFERRTEFEDDTFYDVSTWTLPLAFGLPHAEWPKGESMRFLAADRVTSADVAPVAAPPVTEAPPVAYAFEWHDDRAPAALQRLQAAEVRTQAATRPFQAETAHGPRSLDYGTIVIPTGVQDVSADEVRRLVDSIAADGITVHALTTGLTPGGIDLGSPSMPPLTPPKPLLVVGSGTSSNRAGELWHLLDTRYGLAVSLIESDDLDSRRLHEYTHIILGGGSFRALETRAEEIRDWVRAGGVLLAVQGGAHWATRQILRRAEQPDDGDDDDDEQAEDEPNRRPYADYEQLRSTRLVSGAIFDTHLDRTHPLGFGYLADRLAVFRTSTTILELDADPFANVLAYTAQPLMSGYASEENVEAIADTAAVIANRLGSGTVIRLADAPNFRGFWYGTSRLVANALWFGGIIKRTRQLGEADAIEEQEHVED